MLDMRVRMHRKSSNNNKVDIVAWIRRVVGITIRMRMQTQVMVLIPGFMDGRIVRCRDCDICGGGVGSSELGWVVSLDGLGKGFEGFDIA
jgi:hypothetical protein